MPSFGAATFWMNGRGPVEPLRARDVPMLLAAVAFAAGILLARQWHTPVQLLVSCVLLLGLAVLAVRSAPVLGWLAVLALWMGVGCWCAQVQRPLDRQTALHGFADGLSRTVRGHVVALRSVANEEVNRGAPSLGNSPWSVEPGGWEAEGAQPLQSVDLQVEAVEQVTPDVSVMQPVQGGLRLTVTGGAAALHCGDTLAVPVRLREPEVYRDPGAFSYADWLETQGIGALATGQAGKLHVMQRSTRSLQCMLGAAQHWAAERLEQLPRSRPMQLLPAAVRLQNDDAAMLAAMLFGDRAQLSAEQRSGFEQTGSFHLFVVSGLHVALVTGGVFWVLRRFRLPESAAVGLTVVLATSYALTTGFGVPAQRALAMSSLYLIARAMDRERSGLNALGVAAVLILVADPRALGTASFQMTSMVIVAVAGLAVPVGRRVLGPWQSVVRQLATVELDAFLPPRVASRRVRLRMLCTLCQDLVGSWAATAPVRAVQLAVLVAEAVLMAAAIELCMAMPMAVYFHRAVPMAMPANLFLSPLALSLVVCAVATFVLGLASPWLALPAAALCAGLLHTVRAVISFLAGLTWGGLAWGNLRVPGPPWPALALAGVALVFALWGTRASRPVWAWAGVAAVCALPAIALWPVSPTLNAGVLEVTAIDVGQGDSLFVVSPEGRTMLVDAGGPVGRVKSPWDVGEQVVAPYLWSRRLRRLDVVVVTHGHSDHIGGMPAVLRDLRPRELWLSLEPAQSEGMRALLAQAAEQGVQIRWLAAGDRLSWGGVQATVLSPERTYGNFGEARNDDSLVMRLDWGRSSALLEGDAEAPSEGAMVEHGRLAPVTLLKVGHHGSQTSTTPEFLAAVAPREAVISVGQHNTFGHPRWQVLDRLQAAGVRTYRTDRDGAETFLLQPDGIITAHGTSN